MLRSGNQPDGHEQVPQVTFLAMIAIHVQTVILHFIILHVPRQSTLRYFY